MAAIIVFVIIVVIAIPVGFLMSTSIAAGAMGSLLKANAERNNPESELLDTNY